ncbi:MAG: murein hydrolase activator EnvC family protein [Elusimicrobiota bacterium]
MKKNRINLILCFLVILFTSNKILLAQNSSRISEIQNKIEIQKSELMNLEEKINNYRKSLKNLTEKEERLNQSLNKISSEISQKQEKLQKLRDEISRITIEIGQLEERLKRDKKKSRKYYSSLKRALKYYYQEKTDKDSISWFGVYLGGNKNGIYVAEKIVTNPVKRYSSIKKKIEKTLSIKNRLEKKKSDLVNMKEEVVEVQNSFITKRKRQLDMLKQIKEEREKEQEQVNKLDREKEKLKTLIGSLKKRVKNLERLEILAEDFVKAKGDLPWPVNGAVVSNFGKQNHPQLDTVIVNRGIKIKTKQNNLSVKSVAGGEVVYADSFNGMDNMVVIDHGKNYYSIYGKLDDILVEPGQEIDPLQKLGSLSSRILYFEIGKGSSPENPLVWLEGSNKERSKNE